MKKYFQNERGNIMLLSVCLMGVLVVMFLMLTSFVKAFYIKDKASSAAEQASLAATAYVYEKVDGAIGNIDGELSKPEEAEVEAGITEPEAAAEAVEPAEAVSVEVDIIPGKKSLREQIDERTKEILDESSKYTPNEARIEAVDEVLSDELTANNGIRKRTVEAELENALTSEETVNGLLQTVSDVIEENGGKPDSSAIRYFNEENRIEIKTASTYKPAIFENLFPEDGMEVKQKGEGPKVKFIKYLSGFSSREY
ncbi:TadE/TadG family type IV pilus assembly protein [Bacillus songklensis]|uniref:TadE/TadG family type IV pilus assembly protein n=1 Tax=Bacillus songklensis TaxID=1069116 RepID=A0ABV8B4Y7_9BACI